MLFVLCVVQYWQSVVSQRIQSYSIQEALIEGEEEGNEEEGKQGEEGKQVEEEELPQLLAHGPAWFRQGLRDLHKLMKKEFKKIAKTAEIDRCNLRARLNNSHCSAEQELTPIVCEKETHVNYGKLPPVGVFPNTAATINSWNTNAPIDVLRGFYGEEFKANSTLDMRRAAFAKFIGYIM